MAARSRDTAIRPHWQLLARLGAVIGSGLPVVMLGASCTASLPTPLASREPPSPAAPSLDPDALVWVLPSRPSILDPARMRDDPAAAQVCAQIFDRLVEFRPGTTELAPGVAENWTSSPDGSSFTFTLREGVQFHDGTPLDAAAVVWNLQRWMDPKHVAHKGEFRAWRDYFGGFVGETDPQGRAINLVSRVEALDRRTVRIVLHAPFAPLVYHLAMPPFGLASPTAVLAQGEAFGTNGAHLPVGSGPFKAAAWTDDGAIALVANGNHWSGPPALPALWFVPIGDLARRIEAVSSAQAHATELLPTEALTTTSVAGATFVPRPPRSTAWLMLNQSREPLGDPRVRRAISMAIDRWQLAEQHFGPAAVPASQLLPPAFLGYEPSIEPMAYDPEKSKALLAEAGVTALKLNIWVANTPRPYLPDPLGTAEKIANMLALVGIQATVKSENMRQFLMDRDRGRFTAWLTGWEMQSADPDSTWFWHFGAGRLAAEGHYEKPELAAALLRAQRTVNTSQREEIYRAAALTVAADEARIFLVHARPRVLVADRVDGYLPSPMGFDSFRDVSVRPLSPVQPEERPVLPAPETATVTATLTITLPATSETAPPAGTAATSVPRGGTP